MAYLILENKGTRATDSGGFFDFNPENSNEVADIRNLLIDRRAGNHGFKKPVNLLCSSSDEPEKSRNGIFSMIARLFGATSEKTSNCPYTRTVNSKSVRSHRRTGRSTSDLPVA